MDKHQKPAEPPLPHQELIPGAHESDTLTHREPGAMGGRFNGEDAVSSDESALSSEETRREWRRIGGGGDGER